MEQRPPRGRWWFSAALLLSGFALGVAVTLPVAVDAEPGEEPYARLNAFARVMSYIERSYVDSPDQPALIEAAIKGMVSSLDPHSAYFTPEEYAALRKEAEGVYVGVGLELGVHDGEILVVTPVEGAPADRAGVRPGDRLRAINGAPSRGWTLREAVSRLAGPEGSAITLELMRPLEGRAQGEIKIVELRREPLEVEPLVARPLTPGYGYLRVRLFQPGVAAQAEAALEDLETQAGPLEGLVLDLRNNPGGLLIEGVRLADLFIDEGPLVITRGRDRGQNEVFQASRAATIFRKPVVVLVNGGTASASELVAGAFQDHKRGLLVGERTYGKGSVQSIIDLKGGAGLKLTTARYYTPSERSIHERGITPDVIAPPGAGRASERWYTQDRQITDGLEKLRAVARGEGAGQEEDK